MVAQPAVVMLSRPESSYRCTTTTCAGTYSAPAAAADEPSTTAAAATVAAAVSAPAAAEVSSESRRAARLRKDRDALGVPTEASAAIPQQCNTTTLPATTTTSYAATTTTSCSPSKVGGEVSSPCAPTSSIHNKYGTAHKIFAATVLESAAAKSNFEKKPALSSSQTTPLYGQTDWEAVQVQRAQATRTHIPHSPTQAPSFTPCFAVLTLSCVCLCRHPTGRLTIGTRRRGSLVGTHHQVARLRPPPRLKTSPSLVLTHILVWRDGATLVRSVIWRRSSSRSSTRTTRACSRTLIGRACARRWSTKLMTIT